MDSNAEKNEAQAEAQLDDKATRAQDTTTQGPENEAWSKDFIQYGTCANKDGRL